MIGFFYLLFDKYSYSFRIGRDTDFKPMHAAMAFWINKLIVGNDKHCNLIK